jgi:hypothetical protein
MDNPFASLGRGVRFMTQLVACTGCGGLKRADSPRCPHCQLPVPRSERRTGRLWALGFGALAACNSSYTPGDAYGLVSLSDAGDSGYYTAADAYGFVSLPDDAGDSGSYTPADAYGVASLIDAGVDDGGADAGDGGD